MYQIQCYYCFCPKPFSTPCSPVATTPGIPPPNVRATPTAVLKFSKLEATTPHAVAAGFASVGLGFGDEPAESIIAALMVSSSLSTSTPTERAQTTGARSVV